MKSKLTNKVVETLIRDARRYRFLRRAASRDHQGNTRRAMSVGFVDWGRNMKDCPLGNRGFWSVCDVHGPAMDRIVDAMMKKSKPA